LTGKTTGKLLQKKGDSNDSGSRSRKPGTGTRGWGEWGRCREVRQGGKEENRGRSQGVRTCKRRGLNLGENPNIRYHHVQPITQKDTYNAVEM
jgi:hypothetical protein